MWNGIIEGVHWEPSDKCNSGCPMCPRYTRDGFETSTLVNTEWTFDSFVEKWPVEFLKNLRKILSCGNFGDPCACRDFSSIYQYVREINPGIGLACNTNGSLRTTDWWYNLGKVMREEQNKGNYCTFSLDGLADTNHLYRRNTNFDKIIENAQAYIDGGGIAHWDFIVFKHNEHQVEEAKNLAKKMGFKNFNIKRTTRWSSYKDGQGYFEVMHKGKHLYNLEQPSDKPFKHNFEDATYFKRQNRQSMTLQQLRKVDGKDNVQDVMVNGKWREIPLNKLNVACRAVKGNRKDATLNEIFISANGTVAPCCFLGSEPFLDKEIHDENYIKILEIDGGVERFNMHKYDLFEILQRAAFQKYIPDTWRLGKKTVSSFRLRPFKCGSCCGVEFNTLDFGELGNKLGSYLDEE